MNKDALEKNEEATGPGGEGWGGRKPAAVDKNSELVHEV